MRVLLADQDFSTGRGIRAMLLQSGFTVATIEEMDDVPSYARYEDFDVILMVTPRQARDPYAMVAAVRRAGITAPIMLVGAGQSLDVVRGLNAGADELVGMPVEGAELVARCRALLRRSASPVSRARVLEHANLCLYQEECRVTRDGLEVNLSPKEYRLLELFMQHPRRVWSRDQLLEQLWGVDYIGDSKTVDVHIRWLREKLEENPSSPVHLITVRGFGYRFG